MYMRASQEDFSAVHFVSAEVRISGRKFQALIRDEYAQGDERERTYTEIIYDGSAREYRKVDDGEWEAAEGRPYSALVRYPLTGLPFNYVCPDDLMSATKAEYSLPPFLPEHKYELEVTEEFTYWHLWLDDQNRLARAEIGRYLESTDQEEGGYRVTYISVGFGEKNNIELPELR